MGDPVAIITKIKDILFVQTGRNKEIVYWTCELIAGLILTIFLVKVKTIEGKIGDTTIAIYKPEADESVIDENGNTNTYASIKSHPLNNEYGWIALFWALKHLLFLVDSALKAKNDKNQRLGLISPFFLFVMWTSYAMYGFLYKWMEINAGLFYRALHGQSDTESSIGRKQMMKLYKMDYSYILPILVFLINIGTWIFSLIKKMPSHQSNQAVATWLIPIQMVIFSLFYEGRWIKSNYGKDINEENSDVFEARWVYLVPYIGSYVGLVVFAPACVFLAVKIFRTCKMSFVKWVLWAVFYVIAFIFCLLMDVVLYNNSAKYAKLAGTFCAIGLIVAIAIGVVSILKKVKDGDKPPSQ